MKIMILGTGEVGKACAHYILAKNNNQFGSAKITLQCRTPASQIKLCEEFSYYDNIEIYCSDIFTIEGMEKLKSKIANNCPHYIIDTLPIGNILTKIHHNSSLENATNILFQYIDILKNSFTYGVKRIQKVSSGGAGGLGINCPYRHGISESSSFNLLLWKSFFNGALHQLLININESSKASIGLTIPRALIGYEKSNIGYLVGCGDKTFYTRTELELCAAPSQFGFINKKEVVDAIFNSLFEKSLDLDFICNSYKSSVNSSYKSMQELNSLLEEMHSYEIKNNIKTISTGSLGNSVTKDIIEVSLAIDRSNNEYNETTNPITHLLKQRYFSYKLLGHFQFYDDDVNHERHVNFSKKKLIQWEKDIRLFFKVEKLSYQNIGKYLASIYQRRGIYKNERF